MKRKDILLDLLAALFLAFVLSPFASSWPDGLEKVAKDKGFLAKGEVKPTFGFSHTRLYLARSKE